ncbi:WXG100 family type VII secretion target [Mycolicibacterium neoaurum]|uniref:WXG100 family type VII secretion target n=1 Tax=Mycolicibacterium neoaurum TaxID=1795 RepID=UPI00248AA86A|nr:WXG100 family type VII secretion target [Mycolicibacterium neoaurum]WBP96733.1 WXG100 family type VII secretion target [Mycolicibacterium neoaurum]WBS10419.1 WXG100 family type VII secretion target [Mycolicibacterium neoaurum]
MRYQVELDELVAFVGKLQTFSERAETIAARADSQVGQLHSSWSGDAATAHRSQHDEWMAAAKDMREAVTELRAAAHKAHHHYTEAARLNVEMLS